MLEDGQEVMIAIMATEELKIIRKKMQDFVEEFEAFFGELIQEWIGDTRVFLPTKQLVSKHFG